MREFASDQTPYLDQIEADVFLIHTYLDHIIGLPSFAPLFQSETRLKIYGPVTCEDESLETVIGGQLSYRCTIG